MFVCLFDTPRAFHWPFRTLARGWQTWEDHAALPTNGLARESEHQRGLVLGYINANLNKVIANQKRRQGEAGPKDSNGRRKRKRSDKPQGNRKGRTPGGSTERRHKSRQNNKDRRQTKANENKQERKTGRDPAGQRRTKKIIRDGLSKEVGGIVHKQTQIG